MMALDYDRLPGDPGVSKRALAEHVKLWMHYRTLVKDAERYIERHGLSYRREPILREVRVPAGRALDADVLHEIYFDGVCPGGGAFEGAFWRALHHKFGSPDRWLRIVRKLGLQARGWVVTALAPDGEFRVVMLEGHDLAPLEGALPIVATDVFEHAYWMDYGADRERYLTDWSAWVDFRALENRYADAVARFGLEVE